MSHIQPTPMTRAAAATADAAAVDTTVDPPTDPGRPGHRRPVPRFVRPSPGVRVEVRPWGAGPGPDVAVELLDVSELAIRARLRLKAQVSDRFEVTLRDADGRRVARVMTESCWATPAEDGTVVTMLTLGRLLVPDVLRRLASPSEPAGVGRS